MGVRAGNEICYIVDKKKKLKFDGVFKLSTTSSVTIDEEKGTGSGYTNKAKNAPTEISMECTISELYLSNGANALTNGENTKGKQRPKKALKYLLDLKTSRRLVEVKTGYVNYKNMLLKSIEVEQSPEMQYQIHMNLTFHEVIKSSTKKSSSKETPTSEDDTHTPSNWSNLVYKE